MTIFQSRMFHLVACLTVMTFAIIGGTLVGVSGCANSGQGFCQADPLFVAGFVMLMIMALLVVAWFLIWCCYVVFDSNP